MLVSFLYIFFAIMGLSFLIFIHELGHYFMARHVGMRVETFAIGFGKPIIAWERNGVKWQIGWLLFGGYVKIAGMDLDKDKSPYEVADGFFAKPPLDRIKVAMMGPLTNLAFALLAFSLLWVSGGRDKNFSDFTKKIGWVDPDSELYLDGLRPGDEITAYNGIPFNGAKDHLYAPMTGTDQIQVQGFRLNYLDREKKPFEYTVKVYQHPTALEKGIMTSGITQSANYIIYNRFPDGRENPLPEGSPLIDSGIQYGDRIFWVDGELIFSVQQLNHLLSGNHALLTVERDHEILLVRVPRVPVKELRPDAQFKEELVDWQFEAGLQGDKVQNLYAIPYNLNNQSVVENQLRFIDKEKEEEAFPAHVYSSIESPLKVGDKIIAVNGIPVKYSYELLKELQTYRVNVIVQRDSKVGQHVSWTDADADFNQEVHGDDLEKIMRNLGTAYQVTEAGDLHLLKPITPKTRYEFALSPEKQALVAKELAEQKRVIDSIEDTERKNHALQLWDKQEKRLLLGLPGIQDRQVVYNPGPIELFDNVAQEISRTLSALVSGALNPKWMAGPIGIVQMVHDSSMSSFKEALYWLGAISLNLGILNLLPIPVLDGGTVLMCLLEMVTRRRLHPKTMEKLIIPFSVLLIGFFIFLTYNDLIRLFSGLLH